jgi:hypothetical protein
MYDRLFSGFPSPSQHPQNRPELSVPGNKKQEQPRGAEKDRAHGKGNALGNDTAPSREKSVKPGAEEQHRHGGGD